MQKLQYDQDTLATLLGVGTIHQMMIANVNGREVLRIECEDSDAEYRTVRASKPVQPRKKGNARENYTPRNKSLKLERSVPEPNTTFGSKVLKGIGDWASKPMKRPDEW